MAEKDADQGQEETKKHFGRQEIIAAPDVGSVLETYRRASEQIRRNYELAGLQIAVADRLHQLGDEDKSFQFTLLAGQSQNTERTNTAVENLGEVQSGFHKDVMIFEEGVHGVKNVGLVIGNAGEKMQASGDHVSRAADRIESAAHVIETSSYRMNSK